MKDKEKFFSELTKTKISGGAFSLAVFIPTLFSFLIMIILSAFSLTKDGYEKSDWFLYVSYLITPISFGAISVFYLKKGLEQPKILFRTTKVKYYGISVLLQLGLFSLSELNMYFLELLHKLFGYEDAGISLPSLSGGKIIFVILVIAVLPALLEEIIFRGIILNGLKKFGIVFSVLVCGGLFALYHQNPAQTIYQFVCGACFALVVIKADSIYPTILSHFLNNAAIILLYKFGWQEFPTWFKIPFLCISAFCLLGTLAYLLFIDRSKTEAAYGGEVVENLRKTGTKSQFFLFAAAGILVCSIVWLTTLF